MRAVIVLTALMRARFAEGLCESFDSGGNEP